MDRKQFHENPADPKGNIAKAKELGRRHALEDAIEGIHRAHSIDARKEYVESYTKHREGLKEHEQPHWDNTK